MKKFALLLTLLSLTLTVGAQKQMRIWQGGESTKVNIVDARSMAFASNGSTIDIGGTIYQTADIDSITMIPQVYVTFNESTASVSKIPASIKDYITVETDGAHVTITNTTVSNAEKICVGTKGLQPNSLVVENCTFVYNVADAKPFFDFNNKNWEAFKDKFVFKNCIIGQCGRNKETLATSGITGWSGSIQPECQDIYVTSDVIWTPMSEEDPSPKAAFPCTTLSTNTPQTFKAPLQSDFTIITNELGGTKATPGDPRWY